MRQGASKRSQFGIWLGRVAALIAVAAQLAVALAPLAEGREGASAPAHVDASGTAKHFAHSDDTCAACQAQSLHGAVVRAPVAPAVIPQRRFAVDARVASIPVADPSSFHLSRAPPFLV